VMLPSVAVPGYPRELEAIILTAMANDPNARFQTAQEMIEALDAFAVRAKLTGSNTAMGRFMVQLFGSKKEPWVEGAAAAAVPERTLENESEHDEDNDEKTSVVDDRDRRPSSPPVAQNIPPNPSARRTPPSVTAQLQPAADAAAWQEGDARRPAPRPFESRTPPGGNDQLNTTLAGTGVPRSRPSQPEIPQLRLGSEPISEPGARPLVDSGLGYKASPTAATLPNPGTSTRAPEDYRIRSYRGWVLLVFLMALGVVAGIAIAMSTSP